MQRLPLACAIALTTALSLTACIAPPPPVPGDRAANPPSASGPSSATAAPSENGDGAGTRANPFPAGQTLESDEWSIVIGPTDLDADAEVAAADEYNEPPQPGHRYIRVPVIATYLGDEQGDTWDVEVAFVAASGVTYETHEVYVDADDANPHRELYAGGTVSYAEYLSVPSERIEDGLIRVTAGWYDEPLEAFVTLQ